jgi:hypothetical protein
MQEFIQMAVKQLGINENQATAATGGILQMIQKHAAPADAKQLIGGLPGADALLQKAPQVLGSSSGAGGGGMLGGVLGKASSMLGGQAGGALGAMAMLQQSGLDMKKAGSLVSLFFNFAKGKLGADLIGRVLGKLPELAKIAG